MWNVLCPVYRNKCSRSLVPQQSKGLCDERKSGWDIGKEDDGECYRGISPDGTFRMGWKDKIPSEAMYAAEDDAENCKDDHAGIAVTFGAWGVERGNVSSTRLNCIDLEDGRKCEGGDKEEDEEWA